MITRSMPSLLAISAATGFGSTPITRAAPRPLAITVKNNPIAQLFGDPASDPRVAAFQLQLVRDNVASLAGTGLTLGAVLP